jgi:hypothetical protein
MTPYPHQESISDEAYAILQKYGLVYLNMEERTGKTLISILVGEKSIIDGVFIATKKGALMGDNEKDYKTAKEGWAGTLNAYGRLIGKMKWDCNGTIFTLCNYHGVHKKAKTPKGKTVYKLNYKPEDYGLFILDEAHSYLSAYPKTGVIWKSIAKLVKGKPIIYMSATSSAQGRQLLFNQFKLSNWTPLQFANFYRFHEVYGIPDKIRTAYGLQETYKKCMNEKVWNKVKHLFITHTRKELGFEHEPEDVIHYVELEETTKKIYNYAMQDNILEAHDESKVNLVSPLDSSMKLRTSLHMLEGGVAKVDDEYYILPNDEKIQAILRDFGDSEHLVIMYHYKAELFKLQRYFKNAVLAQATSKAEGVDYSMYEHMAVYSQDWSTARHSQRRARQANKKRLTPIKVHFYLVEGGISEQVYKTVAVNKENFVDSTFVKERL